MPRPALKWSGIVLAALALLLLATAVVAVASTRGKLRRTVELDVTQDVERIASAHREGAADRGSRLAVYRGYVSCHGGDLGGSVVMDDRGFGYFAGPT